MQNDNKKLYFATSSDIKFDQYEMIFGNFGYSLYKAPLIINLIEPQLNDEKGDFELLVSHPLRLVARFVSRQGLIPYIVEDTLLIIKAFSNVKNTKFGLPGADTKNWWNNLRNEGLLELMREIDDRDAEFISVIGGYFGGKNYIFSEERASGSISREVLIDASVYNDLPSTNPYFFHSVFIPKGADKTYAQMKKEEFADYDYRRRNVQKFLKQLQEHYYIDNIQRSFDFD
jgi:XTP/dITP diphosphohydrolase